MTRGWFITGTDTGAGKTRVACALTRALARAGHRVAALKPVAAGCRATPNGWRNDDAEALIACAGVDLPYELVNPYSLPAPVAPHIAASETGVTIERSRIVECVQHVSTHADFVVVEGAGGWLVPIDENETLADVAAALKLPVILVVGLRLGCINHALLTTQAIRSHGTTLAGWVANAVDPEMERRTENLAYLQRRIGAPLLATFAHEPHADIEELARAFDLAPLLHE